MVLVSVVFVSIFLLIALGPVFIHIVVDHVFVLMFVLVLIRISVCCL